MSTPSNSKPYLLSVGIGFPVSGIWVHRYIPVRKKYKQKTIQVAGVYIIWTAYKRIEKDI